MTPRYTIMCDDHGELRRGVRAGWRLRVALAWYGFRHRNCPGIYGQLEWGDI